MPSILALRRRIKAAQNVSKTTKAMQMISASKLKRAQQKTLSIRPYVQKLTELVQSSATQLTDTTVSSYLRKPELLNKTLLIAISPDKGLCGGLITNLIREFYAFRIDEKRSYYLLIGKKIESAVIRGNHEIVASFVFGTTVPTFDIVYPIIHLIEEYYLGGKVDAVKILSSRFQSIFTQVPQITPLLPITLQKEQKNLQSDTKLYEPALSELIPPLLTRYLEMTIYQNLLESFLSEQASRMIAMQNATNNARDIIQDLQLEYNKTRQAKITSEILDLSSGQTTQAYE